MDYRKYEIWHDETKEDGYYHGILLVPLDKREEIISHLKTIRDEHGISYDQDFKFAGSHKTKSKRQFIRNNLGLFSHLIKTKIRTPVQLFNESRRDAYKKEYKPFLELRDLFDCRFGLLKIEDNMNGLSYFNSYSKKVETTLRFVLKGCCHGMFKDNPEGIELTNFYFDGNEHHGNEIDLNRVLAGDFRDYCKISNTLTLDDRGMKHRNDDSKLMINFVDNILGSWRTLIQNQYHKDMVDPIVGIQDKILENKIFSNSNSEYFKSISLSEFSINNDKIQFPNIFRDKKQSSLFDS